MLKRIFSIVAVLALMSQTAKPEPWGGGSFTAGASAQRITLNKALLATSLFVQMDVNTTGVGYLLYAPPNIVCSLGGTGSLVIGKMAPGTSTTPGQWIRIPTNSDPIGGINVGNYCFGSSNPSDVLLVSYNIRN